MARHTQGNHRMDTDSYWPGDMPQCGAALAALLMHLFQHSGYGKSLKQHTA